MHDGYHPRQFIESNTRAPARCWPSSRTARSRTATSMVFRPLVDNLIHHDPFLVLADFADYLVCQNEVSDTWHNGENRIGMSILK